MTLTSNAHLPPLGSHQREEQLWMIRAQYRGARER